MSLCVPHGSRRRPEEAIGFSGAGVTGSCELSCRCLALNPSLLQKQVQVPLTAEPSLQPHISFSPTEKKKPLLFLRHQRKQSEELNSKER